MKLKVSQRPEVFFDLFIESAVKESLGAGTMTGVWGEQRIGARLCDGRIRACPLRWPPCLNQPRPPNPQ